MTASYVYAARVGQYVKIGVSTDVRHRLRSIATDTVTPPEVDHASAVVFLGACLGDWLHEQSLHSRFARYHAAGEWFDAAVEVLDWAATLSPELPDGPPNVHVRLDAAELASLASLADEHGVSRAIVLRAMLSTATQHADEVRRRIALTKEA